MDKYISSKAWWYRNHDLISDLFHAHFKIIVAKLLNIVAVVFHFIGNRSKCARYLMSSIRYDYSPPSIALFKRLLLLDKEVLSPLVSSGVSIREAALRSIVIRWPAYENGVAASKGILIIKFTKVFSYYLRNIDIKKLTKHFHIVLEPSWSGYFDADILCWALVTKEYVFVEATELLDRIALNALTSNLVPLSFGASDWVNYNSHYELDFDKQYDSIYVANTSHIKRIIRYIKAIKKISKNSDPAYKGCLVCASWGGKEEIIRSLPEYFGIESNIEIHFSLNKESLNKVINSSKVNILLSYKEGSNKSLFESMFANVPVICIAENIGVNKCYINEHTGLLISDRFLEDGLLHMKDSWEMYQPKKWAMENIAPEKTTEKLLAILEARGDIHDSSQVYIKTNNPEFSYLDYPDIEFIDINKLMINEFENSLGQDSDNFQNETEIILNCQQTFLSRISEVDKVSTVK